MSMYKMSVLYRRFSTATTVEFMPRSHDVKVTWKNSNGRMWHTHMTMSSMKSWVARLETCGFVLHKYITTVY